MVAVAFNRRKLKVVRKKSEEETQRRFEQWYSNSLLLPASAAKGKTRRYRILPTRLSVRNRSKISAMAQDITKVTAIEQEDRGVRYC